MDVAGTPCPLSLPLEMRDVPSTPCPHGDELRSEACMHSRLTLAQHAERAIPHRDFSFSSGPGRNQVHGGHVQQGAFNS